MKMTTVFISVVFFQELNGKKFKYCVYVSLTYLHTYLCSCFGETVVHKLRQALSVLTDWSRVVFKKQYNMFTKMK